MDRSGRRRGGPPLCDLPQRRHRGLSAVALLAQASAATGAPAPRRPAAPTTVYVRADPDRVEEVAVSRPSDAVAARAAAAGAFASLLLGLAAALLIGALAGLYPAARATRLPRRRRCAAREARPLMSAPEPSRSRRRMGARAPR